MIGLLVPLLALSSMGTHGSHEEDALESQVYKYESISDASAGSSKIAIDLNEGELVYPATITEIKACPNARSHCFQSSRISFCAPTNSEMRAGKWNCGNADLSFSAKGRSNIKILGEEVEVTIIEGTGVEYFYSESRGVLLLRFVGSQVSEVYWSSSYKGFGAL